MSQRYSIAEARSRLSTIVDQAEAGLEVELTRRGQPVAVVVSCRVLVTANATDFGRFKELRVEHWSKQRARR